MNLYLTRGEYHKPDSRYVSHYCGLPVRATSEQDAIERTNLALAPYDGYAIAARPTGRMPILDLADEFARTLAARLTA